MSCDSYSALNGMALCAIQLFFLFKDLPGVQRIAAAVHGVLQRFCCVHEISRTVVAAQGVKRQLRRARVIDAGRAAHQRGFRRGSRACCSVR